MNRAAFCRLAFAATASALVLSHPLAAMPPDPVVVTNPVTLNPNSPNPVTIVNSPNAPSPTVNIGNPDALAKAIRAGQRPVQLEISCPGVLDGGCASAIVPNPPAPANERWTIEFVSLACQILNASGPDFVFSANIGVSQNGVDFVGVELSHPRPEGPGQGQGFAQIFAISQPVLLYAFPGLFPVHLSIEVRPLLNISAGQVSGVVSCVGTMSGYAVTTP
jgi:hypothetical protein